MIGAPRRPGHGSWRLGPQGPPRRTWPLGALRWSRLADHRPGVSVRPARLNRDHGPPGPPRETWTRRWPSKACDVWCLSRCMVSRRGLPWAYRPVFSLSIARRPRKTKRREKVRKENRKNPFFWFLLLFSFLIHLFRTSFPWPQGQGSPMRARDAVISVSPMSLGLQARFLSLFSFIKKENERKQRHGKDQH